MRPGTTPVDGLIEAMPQQWAGLRSEPPRSLPSPSGVIPLASALASPPLEPPAVTSGRHGLRVSPRSDESVCTRRPKSGRLVRANGIAPAARMRSTIGASTGAVASASAGTPWVVGHPATSMFSFTVIGTPCSGPSCAPSTTARSAASAAFTASSPSRATIALSSPFTVSMRSTSASSTARLVVSRLRIAAAISSAPSCHSSPIAPS